MDAWKVKPSITEALELMLQSIQPVLQELGGIRDELARIKRQYRLECGIRSGKVFDTRIEKVRNKNGATKIAPDKWFLEDGSRITKRGPGEFVVTYPDGSVIEVPAFCVKEIAPHRFIVQPSKTGKCSVQRLQRL